MKYLVPLAILMLPVTVQANMTSCLQQAVLSASAETTIGELRQQCLAAENNAVGDGGGLDDRLLSNQAEIAPKPLQHRFRQELSSASNPYVITPHKRNYFLPYTYSDEPNEAPYREAGFVDGDNELNHAEAKFQLSLKIPVLKDVFMVDDAIFFGFTLKSFWQVYNSDISAPFRETNYQPEAFWVAPLDWNPFEDDGSYLSVGVEHQSNGRNLPLSRSWNRVYMNFLWEEGRWAFSFKPWYRLPEDDKSDPADTSGDDNPDIERYMGHFEFTSVYRRHDQEVSLMFRNNLRQDNYGAVQIDWTFPLWQRIRGHVQYFNGYGESMIDYDERIERIGIGFLLTDLL